MPGGRSSLTEDIIRARQRATGQELQTLAALIAQGYTEVGDGNDHTLADDEFVVSMRTDASAATVTLPESLAGSGQIWVIVDRGGNAATNAITIDAEDGANHNVNDSDQNLTISANNGYAVVYAEPDNDNWIVGVSG